MKKESHKNKNTVYFLYKKVRIVTEPAIAIQKYSSMYMHQNAETATGGVQ